ncbi:hypothetical protein F4821DRAFT_230187 [Hypoxylon rubiginosum]|uniref:Uncharacterized protein n=1 Tax=Hypoxylon rubiginosum TaxID=110542 RepID=A0ACC0DAY7_9PEZI|nr:hypothetical protein F4821DRAFT_230187 [Hypoxylon rubiginosum]
MLKNSSLQPCPDPKSCIVSRETRQSPTPAFHMHIEGLDVSISLRAHSQTLWFALPPSADADPTWKSCYIPVSDWSLPGLRPGRGHGAFSADGPRVLILRAHILLEAYIRLASAFCDDFANFSLGIVNYMRNTLSATE